MTSDDYIKDWSPNNIKTVLFGGKQVAVEYFVPIGGTRVNVYPIEDIASDIKAMNMGRPVKSVLKALNQYTVFSNLEEVIFTTDGYDKELFSIDTDISELSMTVGETPTDTFNRLYAITKTTLPFLEVVGVMNQIQAGTHVHYADVLAQNKENLEAKNVSSRYFNKEYWSASIKLQEKNFALDVVDGELYKYLKDVKAAILGDVDYDEVVVKEETLSDFFTTIHYSALDITDTPEIPVKYMHLEFVKDDLYNENMSSIKVKFFLATSLLDCIECLYGSFYNIDSLVITSGNQLLLNNIRICPVMGYNLLLSLPDTLFKLLTGKAKEKFNSIVTSVFGRLPNLEEDEAEFEEWLKTEPLNWGSIFNFRDIYKFPNLSYIAINNPYRIETAKVEADLVQSGWCKLYDKLPSLKTKGLYLNGAYIHKGNEASFVATEKELIKACSIILEYNSVKGFCMTQYMRVSEDTKVNSMMDKVLGKSMSGVVQNKLAGLSANATMFLRKLDL